MSIAEKFEVIVDVVFEKGKEVQKKELWESLIPENRVSFQYAFGGGRWTDDTFQPTRTLIGSNFLRCFAESAIKTISQPIDASTVTSASYMQNMFYNADVVTITELILSENTAFDSTTFRGCSALKNLKVTGTIGKNGFDISYAVNLSAASILSILKACKKESAAVTITLPKKCINGNTVTETYIASNTELNTLLTNATTKGYTVIYA